MTVCATLALFLSSVRLWAPHRRVANSASSSTYGFVRGSDRMLSGAVKSWQNPVSFVQESIQHGQS